MTIPNENKTVQTVEFNANHDYTKWKTKQSKLLSSTLTMTPNCTKWKTKQSKLLSSTLTMTDQMENKTVQTVEFNANHDYTKWKTKQSKLLSSTLTMTIPNGKQNSPNC